MPSRRLVLRGIGGALLGLPLLESAGGAGPVTNPHYLVVVRQGNGVVQDRGGTPDLYWPHVVGPLTSNGMRTRDADRAVSELADWADRLLLVKGTAAAFPGNGCAHAGAGNQLLTGAQVSVDPEGPRSLGMGESIDNTVARHAPNNGGEPLTLYTGPRSGSIHEMMSYRGPMDLRAGEDYPWDAYLRMVGGLAVDPLLEGRRRSVNDLVRDQMQTLLGGSDLSTSDRQRLELHFDSVREFELMACRLSDDAEEALQGLEGQGTLDENRVTIARMHCDLVALACACDHIRAATIQVGDGNDPTSYEIDGVRTENYHAISHRFVGSDPDTGTPVPDAVTKHHAIDRLHLKIFARMLEKMDQYGILDSSVVVHTNELGDGANHTAMDLPWIIAGSGDGLLATGKYVHAGNVTHNLLLNTLISATGMRNADGEPIDDFGDASLDRGLIPAMLA
jgi:hypothetical protein